MARGAVVVTGASTGIGEATAAHLSSLGFDVFAGVRKDSDANRAQEAGLRPLVVDVTDAGSISRARDEVEGALQGGPLAGLVNNAGIAVSGPLEFMPPKELRHQRTHGTPLLRGPDAGRAVDVVGDRDRNVRHSFTVSQVHSCP